MPRLTASQRRERIIAATIAVARRKGLAATTVRDVADEMGSSSGLVHHYFGTMDDVLAEAFAEVAGEDLARTTRALAGVTEPVDALRGFVESYARVDANWAFRLWLDAWAEAPRRPAVRAISQRLNLGWEDLLEAIIRRGIAAGAMTASDPRAAAWTILSILDGLALQVVAHDAAVALDEVVPWAAAAAERELGLPPGAIGARRDGRPPGS